MERLPLEVQTLYAELLERLAAYEAQRAIGHVAGTFVTKSVKGHDYYYFQHLEPGGAKRQIYVGRKDDALDAVVRRYGDARRETAEDERSIDRLCAQLRAGGIMATDVASARVLKGLSDAGVFRLGGVLVGTHAFTVIGNMLGVSWSGAALRTQDIDVAAGMTMSVAVPEMPADVPAILDSLEMGFLPVPGLDRTGPSTSFKVRGKGLRVDLLAPVSREATAPVSLPRFNASAQPLRFLDLVTEASVRGAVVNGGGVSVFVPDPARFALHKLIVAGERPAVGAAKRDKDLSQAAQVLDVLCDDRPGDVGLAWEAVVSRGPGWVKRVRAGVGHLAKTAPDVAARADRIMR